MRHGSLFSGIGGFDLASEWMGWENVFHCEWNEFGQKVLKYHFPNAESFNDITKTDFKKYADTIDILTGGFPCQPFSLAGKRKGTNDERYLWHEMLRAIREIKPKWVIAENVFSIVNIDGGMVFEQVCVDLEAEGYEVQSFIIPACAKNAPHRRDRCWFIAQNTMHSGCVHRGNEQERTEVWQQRNTCARDSIRICLSKGNATNTNNNGQNKCDSQHEINTSQGGINALGDIESLHNEQSIIEYTNGIGQEWRMHKVEYKTTIREQFSKRNARSIATPTWHNFPTQSPICSGDDGLPTQLDGITFSKWRNESIKAYGNAIVPQIAYELFKIIANEH